MTVRLFPETNHLFLYDPVRDFSAYATLPERQVRPVILGELADWLAPTLGATH